MSSQEKVTGCANKIMEKPFGLMLESLDDQQEGEIFVNRTGETRCTEQLREVGRKKNGS